MTTEELANTTTMSSGKSLPEKAEQGPTEQQDPYGIRAHWKCVAACTLVSMCPFQYGVDFGLIGNLQAMVGFLEVRD